MNDIAEALRLAMQSAQHGQPDDGRDDVELTDTQIVSRLRDCFAALGEHHDFTPGQILIHKWPSMRDTRGGVLPMIFVEYKDFGDPRLTDPSDMFSNSLAKKPDCVIGTIRRSDSGKYSFVKYPACADELQPHPDFQSDTLPNFEPVKAD